MYKLEIETNNTVKRIEDPRKVKVVCLGITTLVKVMDGNGKWTTIGHTFFYQYADLIGALIVIAIAQKKTFIEVDLN